MNKEHDKILFKNGSYIKILNDNKTKRSCNSRNLLLILNYKRKAKGEKAMIFKEILNKLDKIKYSIIDLRKSISDMNEILNKYEYIIKKQDEIVQALLENQVTNKEFECMVFVPYRGKPVVIKDGIIVSTDNMSYFDITCHCGDKIDVSITE